MSGGRDSSEALRRCLEVDTRGGGDQGIVCKVPRCCATARIPVRPPIRASSCNHAASAPVFPIPLEFVQPKALVPKEDSKVDIRHPMACDDIAQHED